MAEELYHRHFQRPDIKAGLFNQKGFLQEEVYALCPIEGSYVHVPNQKCIGYRVDQVIFLPSNYAGWSVALVLGYGLNNPTKEMYQTGLHDIESEKLARVRLRNTDREKLNNPDKHWQRRRDIYLRISAGETYEALAKELGIKPARVKALYSDWRYLKMRNNRYDFEEKKVKDGEHSSDPDK